MVNTVYIYSYSIVTLCFCRIQRFSHKIHSLKWAISNKNTHTHTLMSHTHKSLKHLNPFHHFFRHHQTHPTKTPHLRTQTFFFSNFGRGCKGCAKVSSKVPGPKGKALEFGVTKGRFRDPGVGSQGPVPAKWYTAGERSPKSWVGGGFMVNWWTFLFN